MDARFQMPSTGGYWQIAKKYLQKLEEDADAVIGLGDSAYLRSNIKKEMGIATPVSLPNDGSQPTVIIFSLFF
jgi:hypothetical protein